MDLMVECKRCHKKHNRYSLFCPWCREEEKRQERKLVMIGTTVKFEKNEFEAMEFINTNKGMDDLEKFLESTGCGIFEGWEKNAGSFLTIAAENSVQRAFPGNIIVKDTNKCVYVFHPKKFRETFI